MPAPQLTQSGRITLTPEGAIGGRSMYSATFLVPGFVDASDGTTSNWLIPADVLRRDAHLFDGVACYLDHPEVFGFGFRGEPQVKNLIGVTSDVHYQEADDPDNPAAALVGNARLYADDPNSPGAFVKHILDAMLADKEAGNTVPNVGLSAVFYHESELDEDSGNRITTAFKKVESVDLVYSPGAGGYIKQALATQRQAALSAIRPGTQFERSNQVESKVEYNTSPPAADTIVSPNPVDVAIENLTVAQRALSDQLQPLTADLEGEPPVTPQQSAVTIEDLHAQVQQLSQAVSNQDRTVQGMGQAPADTPSPTRVGALTTGMDHMQAAMDWIFGVPDALTPAPELRRMDYLYRLLTGDLNWTGVFDEREALSTANTTTLPNLAVNAMNKVIVPLYDRLMVYRWYEQIVSVQPTDGSLHDMAWLQFGGIGDLPVVAEGAAYTELTVGDSKETDSFTKYGGYVGITEKMIRNSDIARIQAVPRAMVVSAVQTRSAKIAALFSSNSGVGPTLDQDSKALFHSDHSNLATTAFSWTAWKAARIQCAKHAELTSAKRSGFMPKFCLVPIDLFDEALQAFGYGDGTGGQPGTANNDVNPYGESRPADPRPVPISVPDWTDTNDWAYLVDPLIAPVVQMAYADSPSGGVHPPPQLFTVTSKLAGLMFTNDVLPIKVRDYWAYGVSGYRGIGKRNVT